MIFTFICLGFQNSFFTMVKMFCFCCEGEGQTDLQLGTEKGNYHFLSVVLSLQRFITDFLLPNFRLFSLGIWQKGRALRQKKIGGVFHLLGVRLYAQSHIWFLLPDVKRLLNACVSIIDTALHRSLAPADSNDITNVLLLWFLSYPCRWCEALWFSPHNSISSLYFLFCFVFALSNLYFLFLSSCKNPTNLLHRHILFYCFFHYFRALL